MWSFSESPQFHKRLVSQFNKTIEAGSQIWAPTPIFASCKLFKRYILKQGWATVLTKEPFCFIFQQIWPAIKYWHRFIVMRLHADVSLIVLNLFLIVIIIKCEYKFHVFSHPDRANSEALKSRRLPTPALKHAAPQCWTMFWVDYRWQDQKKTFSETYSPPG